jgi:hypothetical protein
MSDDDYGESESSHGPTWLPRRRLLALAGGSLTAGLAGCSGDGDGTSTPGRTGTEATPTSTDGNPTTATLTPTATPTDGDPTTPTPTETPAPDPETYYTVSGQEEWEIARGTTEGANIEDGILSVDGGSDTGRFETIRLSGTEQRDLRLRVQETPLWDSWTYQGLLRDFTDGQAAGTNDTVMFVDMDEEYPYKMSALDTGPNIHYWWQSRDFENWEQICQYDDHPTDSWGGGTNFQFGRVDKDGQFRIYSSFNDDVTTLWKGEDVCSLERIGEVHPNPDSGGFYEPETDTWHLYYEAEGEVPYNGGPTSNALGHSTSTSGTDGWEDQGNVVDLSEMDEHTGDPEVIQVGDTYFMFIDFSINHPDYRQAVMTSPDLYDWTFQGQVTHEKGGDFTVRYIPDRGDFVALAEFGPGGGVSVFTSPGPASNSLSATLNLDTTGDGTLDETVETQRNVEYGIGEDMSQIMMSGSSATYTWAADFDTVVPAGRPFTVSIGLGSPGTKVTGFELVG